MGLRTSLWGLGGTGHPGSCDSPVAYLLWSLWPLLWPHWVRAYYLQRHPSLVFGQPSATHSTFGGAALFIGLPQPHRVLDLVSMYQAHFPRLNTLSSFSCFSGDTVWLLVPALQWGS